MRVATFLNTPNYLPCATVLDYYSQMKPKEVRPLIPSDRSEWKKLWRGYIEFYKAELPEEMYVITWERILDQNFNLYGLGAFIGNELQGITHYSFQNSTWASTNYCYLEDLFVNPSARGAGLGRALIDEVKMAAIKAGSKRLYWNTDRSNETARKLYDSYILESGKVQYRIPLQ